MHVLLFLLCFLAAEATATSLESFQITFPTERIFSTLTNRDVYWDMNYGGVEPVLSPNAKEIVQFMDQARLTQLHSWLSDPERAVVAHVLITLVNMRPYRVSGNSWNGLHFISNDSFTCPKEELESLRKRWPIDRLPRPPNQPTQRNAGSRPSSGDSSAYEIPSSLGPRG